MKILKGVSDYFGLGHEEPTAREVGRNEPCWCGSGKKYKSCHLREDEMKQLQKYFSNCGPV